MTTLIAPSSESQVLQELVHIAAKLSGGESSLINPDASITEMGIDSLGLAEFMFNVEDRFGVPIDNERLQTMQTLTDLSRFIYTAASDNVAQP